MNVPKLRFREFNDEWIPIKLSSILKERKEKTGNTEKYPLWSLTIENGVTPKTDRYERSFLVKREENYKIVYPDDFVYNPMNAHLGAIARYKGESVISVSGYYDIFRINDKNFSYFENYFVSPVMFKKYKLISTGSLLEKQRVHYSQFKELIINIPSADEKEKISKTLELLDKKIELQSKKIEDLKLFKLGKMKMIFKTAEHNIILKNICIIEKGRQINNKLLLNSGMYYMLNGGILPSGFLNEYNTEKNTITISEGGNSCGFVNFNKKNFWCGGHCYKLLNEKIDKFYLYQLLKYNENKIMNLRVGSGLPNIQKKALESLKLKIHNEEKQKVIANYLTYFDKKNKLEIDKLNNLLELKKGLMQNMFI